MRGCISTIPAMPSLVHYSRTDQPVVALACSQGLKSADWSRSSLGTSEDRTPGPTVFESYQLQTCRECTHHITLGSDGLAIIPHVAQRTISPTIITLKAKNELSQWDARGKPSNNTASMPSKCSLNTSRRMNAHTEELWLSPRVFLKS